MTSVLETIRAQAAQATHELLAAARLAPGDLLVVGCSSSEVCGERIGTHSSTEVADALFGGIAPVAAQAGVFLAAQCCEHLNRALIVPGQAARLYRLPVVNVVPQPKAGGSFATAAWRELEEPTAVESLLGLAAAGMDIGDTLIGMHLRPVAVPVRLSLRTIGQANLVCARTRPKFIGGARAVYDERLL